MKSKCLPVGVPVEFVDPPREFSVFPFWFWNDDLKEEEILRQIADFDAHGVYGFVIHPRIGLPKEIAWMSPRMLGMMRVAIEEAARRDMRVVLYDEGMYPSGSACGQVVARNPAHAARGLWKIDLDAGAEPKLEDGWNLVAVLDRAGGKRLAVVDRPSRGFIRGLHYIGEGTGELREDAPPAGDILNPDAVASFIDLVHERFAQEFGTYFGSTILGVFTDEPSEMGRGAQGGMIPGSAAVLKRVNRHLGYDFTPYLADLWYADCADAAKRCHEYHHALHLVLGETYYQPLSEWCAKHGIALMGHPGASSDLGFERYFHVPGQDLVWRYVEPGPKALVGEHSTMAKCASSAMVHLGRRRNGNELYGAYGHDLTFDEVKWLANWCFVRGQNLLYPHAFYYSVRGPRRDERPPDVGPNSEWWPRFKPYADACRRLCWVNTDCKQVCAVAVLAGPQQTPDRAAAVLFQNQRDFNYLEWRHLWEDARVDDSGVHIAGMTYSAVILDQLAEIPPGALSALRTLATAGRLVGFRTPISGIAGVVAATDDATLVSVLNRLAPPDIILTPATTSIRVRHVIKSDRHIILLFNEGGDSVTTCIMPVLKGASEWWDAETATVSSAELAVPVTFKPHEMKVLSLTIMKSATQADAASGFQFEGCMSKDVLRSFASRAITHQGLCVVGTSPDPIFEEDLRMVCNMGAKLIGRAAFYSWNGNMTAEQIDTHYRIAKERAAAVHAVDPEIILQAGVFEIAYEQTVNNTVIPAPVFEQFGLPAGKRTFRYLDMVFPAGTRDVLYGMDSGIGCWGNPSSGVPDITQLETKMYFYYCITRYIDAGYEAFHMGQAEKMMRYQGNAYAHHWDAVLAPARAYAKTHARRGIALFDNHDAVDSAGIMIDDRLLFDIQGAGMVPDETVQEDGVQKCRLKHYDECKISWIGRSGGGIHPLGFKIEVNFTIIELDNYGRSSRIPPGVATPQNFYNWGYDDVTWFALQPEWYRNQFLQECDAFLCNTAKILDSEGKQQYFLQPVCRRVVTYYPTMLYKPLPNCDRDAVLRYLKEEKTEVADNGDGSYTLTVKGDYRSNTQSDSCPNGFNQEGTIREIFLGRAAHPAGSA